jgi:hypothetical protein
LGPPQKGIFRVTTRWIGMTRIGRLLRGATVAGLTLLLVGCSDVPGPLKRLSPLGHSQDESLRKQVEADSFPNAKKVGL